MVLCSLLFHLYFSNKFFIFLILFYFLFFVTVVLLLVCFSLPFFLFVVLFYLVVVSLIFLFFLIYIFYFSNFIFYSLLLHCSFLFFCHFTWLTGPWSQAGGQAWAPVVGALSSNHWTKREPQTTGNIEWGLLEVLISAPRPRSTQLPTNYSAAHLKANNQ